MVSTAGRISTITVCLVSLLSLGSAFPRPHPHPRALPMPMYNPYDPNCPYPQGYPGGGFGFNGLYGSGDSGYAQGYGGYSSYSGYGAGNLGGYGGGYADPSGMSASAFGVGYGR